MGMTTLNGEVPINMAIEIFYVWFKVFYRSCVSQSTSPLYAIMKQTHIKQTSRQHNTKNTAVLASDYGA